jgi:hypothetical protein
MKNLAKKLVQVVGSVSGKVGKSGYNSHQKYNYVMEADLLDAVREEIVKAGIVITSSVESVERDGNITTVKLKHTLIDAESGESFEVWSAGQGADNQDKGVFKAITGANKYFLLKTFLLSGDDDPENDGAKAPAPQQAKAPVMKVAAPKPAAPQTETVQPKAEAATASPAPTGTKKPTFNAKPKAAPQPAPADTKASGFSFGVTKVDPATLPEPAAQASDDIEF